MIDPVIVCVVETGIPICPVKNKVKAPLNKDYLFKMLQDYFKDNPEIDSNHVSDFILENRPIIEKSILVIKQNK